MLKQVLVAAAVPAAVFVFGFSGSAYAATAACNFPAEPSEKLGDTKVYDIPCFLGTGDAKEYQKMIISGANFPPDIGYKWVISRVRMEWRARPSGEPCLHAVNFGVAPDSSGSLLKLEGRADQEDGQNCGGEVNFKAPEVKE